MAHRFLNYMLDDEGRATTNFTDYVGYQPPQHGDQRRDAVRGRGAAAEPAPTALVTREAYANGNAYLTLTAEGQRLWDRGWAEFRTG